MKKWLALIVASLALITLFACSDKKEEAEFDTEKAAQDIEKGTVGFEMLGGEVKEANQVPAEEKKKIEAAFAEYIEAFNSEDLNRYMATLSKHPKGFDYEEDKTQFVKMIKQYDDKRVITDVTVIKYSEKEAQVFANLSIERLEQATNKKVTYSGRQVTVFAKEEGAWKVSSIYFIGNDAGTESKSK